MSLLPLLLLGALFPAADPARVEAAVRRAYEDEVLQRALPARARPVKPSPIPEPLVSSPGFSPPKAPRLDPARSGAIRALLYTLGVVVLCLVAVWAAREWAPFWPGGPRRARRAGRAPPGGRAREVPPGVPPPLPEHRRLAEAGRFAEAIHALLVAALREVERRERRPFPPALTSREILDRIDGNRLRAPLSGLVAAVERTVFGGQEADREDYRECEGRLAEIQAAGGNR